MAVSHVFGVCFDPHHPPAAAFDRNDTTFFTTTGLYPHALRARFTRDVNVAKVRVVGAGIRCLSIRLQPSARGAPATSFRRELSSHDADVSFPLSSSQRQLYTGLTVCVEAGTGDFSVLRQVDIFAADDASTPLALKAGAFIPHFTSSPRARKAGAFTRSPGAAGAGFGARQMQRSHSDNSFNTAEGLREAKPIVIGGAARGNRQRVSPLRNNGFVSIQNDRGAGAKASSEPLNRAAVVKRISGAPPQLRHTKAAKAHLRRFSLRAGSSRSHGARGKPLIKSPRPDDLEHLLGAGALLAKNSLKRSRGGSSRGPVQNNNTLQRALLAFREADRDGDGVLDPSEVLHMVATVLARKHGKKPLDGSELAPRFRRVVDHLMYTYDGDLSGGLDFAEFMLLHGAVKQREVSRQHKLLEAMQRATEERIAQFRTHGDRQPSWKTINFYKTLLNQTQAQDSRYKTARARADDGQEVHKLLRSDDDRMRAVISLFAEAKGGSKDRYVEREGLSRGEALQFLHRHEIRDKGSAKGGTMTPSTGYDAMLNTMMRLRIRINEDANEQQALGFEQFCQWWSPVLREMVAAHLELLGLLGDRQTQTPVAHLTTHTLTGKQRRVARTSFWDLLKSRHTRVLDTRLLTKAAVIFFQDCDLDGNQVLDAAELTQLLRKLQFPATAASDVELLLRAYDLDGDGTLSFAEFSKFWSDAKSIDDELAAEAAKNLQQRKNKASQRIHERKTMRKWSHFWKALQQKRAEGAVSRPIDTKHLSQTAAIFFAECDKNQVGLLDEADLLQVLQKLDCGAVQPEDVRDMLRVYDTNGDGKLNLEEFARFFVDVRSLEQQAQERRDELLEADRQRHHVRLKNRLNKMDGS